MERYTIAGRLSDVLALISLLSVDRRCFRTLNGVNQATRSSPLSADNWFAVAALHPEFFRFNDAGDTVALLIRSYFPEEVDENNEKGRKTLSVSETQKLMDTAISLHDKEILLSQKNNYRWTVFTSLAVAIIAVCGSIFTTVYNGNANAKLGIKVDVLTESMKDLAVKLDTLNNRK